MSGRKATTPEARFNEKWRLLSTGCKEWIAARDEAGYGRFCDEHGQMQLAHRWIFQREHKVTLPAHIDVCHSCDYPPCVNLAHLFDGTRLDNMQDCVAKGRTSHEPRNVGEKHPMARLTAEQVIEIRQQRALELPLSAIADEFGVSIAHVHRIATRQAWAHV